jgi:ribonuclease E
MCVELYHALESVYRGQMKSTVGRTEMAKESLVRDAQNKLVDAAKTGAEGVKSVAADALGAAATAAATAAAGVVLEHVADALGAGKKKVEATAAQSAFQAPAKKAVRKRATKKKKKAPAKKAAAKGARKKNTKAKAAKKKAPAKKGQKKKAGKKKSAKGRGRR